MTYLGAQFKGTPVSELSGFILSLYALQLGTAQHVAKGLPVYSNKGNQGHLGSTYYTDLE